MAPLRIGGAAAPLQLHGALACIACVLSHHRVSLEFVDGDGAQVGFESRIVGVLVLVEALREDGVDDVAALLVDEPPHLYYVAERGPQ